MKHHTQSYVICATPRSGTTLLCDLLDDTGIAGRPDSFFRLQSIRRWAQTLDVPVEEWSDEHAFDRAFLSAVLREGRSGTQVFGMRLMWEQANNLAKRLDALYPALSSDSARFRAAFGPICFIHLSRSDKDAQAVSLIKAEQTGLWHVHTDGSERERVKPAQAPAYDAQVLSAHGRSSSGTMQRGRTGLSSNKSGLYASPMRRFEITHRLRWQPYWPRSV